DQGIIEFRQRFIFLGNHQKVFPYLGNKAGGGDLRANILAPLTHRVEVRQLISTGAVRVFPIDLSVPESYSVDDNALRLWHSRLLKLPLRRGSAHHGSQNPRLQGIGRSWQALCSAVVVKRSVGSHWVQRGHPFAGLRAGSAG